MVVLAEPSSLFFGEMWECECLCARCWKTSEICRLQQFKDKKYAFRFSFTPTKTFEQKSKMKHWQAIHLFNMTYFQDDMEILSGQIITTSHDITPKGSWGREIPSFQQNLSNCNLARWLYRSLHISHVTSYLGTTPHPVTATFSELFHF